MPINLNPSTYVSINSNASVSAKSTGEWDGASLTANTTYPFVKTKHGTIRGGSKEGLYTWETDVNGEYTFTDNTGASVESFDASSANGKVTVLSTANTSLTTIKTGSGKDSIAFTGVSPAAAQTINIDSGSGDDIIHITGNKTNSSGNTLTANITMGSGRDTLSLTTVSSNKGSIVANISDYDYSEGDVVYVTTATTGITWGSGNNGNVTVDASGAHVSVDSVTVHASMDSNNGVYELKIGKDAESVTTYAGTTESNVEYTASEAVNFYSTNTTDGSNLTLNLTKGDNKANINTSGNNSTLTLNVAGSASADVTVGQTVDVTLGITKKTGAVTLSTADHLDTSDTLYLNDGGKISDVVAKSGEPTTLVYGSASVTNAFASNAEGKFNYSNGTETGILAYGNTSGDTVSFAEDVTYYTRATTLTVGDTKKDVVINLDGATGVQYASTINTIKGVTSGLVAGRTGKANTIELATGDGESVEVRGGAGADDNISLNAADPDGTTKVWYSIGDGKDTVSGYNKGNNSIYFHNAYAQTKLLNDALEVSGTKAVLTLSSSDVLTLNDIEGGKTLTFTDAEDKVYNVAVSDGSSVKYDADTKIYKATGSSVALKVSGDDDYLCIYTGGNNDQYGYYDAKIKSINAEDATGTLQLSGTNVAGFQVQGGKGINHLYGGGDKSQTLVGTNSAVDVFWFGSGDGNDTATKAEATDGLNLYNVENIDDVKVTVGSNYFTVNVGSDNLKVTTGDAKATSVLQGFTFANQAGTLYTYDTTTKSFQQK